MSLYNSLKRLSDIAVSLFALIVLLLPMIIISAALMIFNKISWPFFTQIRTGKDAFLFKIIKFKTMTDEKDSHGKLLPDKDRLTPLGRIIRSSSLDELPQLFNVLKGDMSLVGPRPLLEKYIPLYSKEQFRRHEVKPGITGWAQVNGRNAISWEQKFAYDVWYVDHQSFWLDMKILYLTVLKVFKREGISAAGQATTEAFKGNQSSNTHTEE